MSEAIRITVRVHLDGSAKDDALRALCRIWGYPAGVPLEEATPPGMVEAAHALLASEDIEIECEIDRAGRRRYSITPPGASTAARP